MTDANMPPVLVGINTSTQPPGSGNMANRLIDSNTGTTAAATYAGELTLDMALKPVKVLVAGAAAVNPVTSDRPLAKVMDGGNAWVRINLTANELLAELKIGLAGTRGKVDAEVSISLGGVSLKPIVAPIEDELRKAIKKAVTEQGKDAIDITNREEIVSQANDAGLTIARALDLDVLKHRRFLYLFDVMEFVLARPLYEAKLHLDVNRPSIPLLPPPGSTVPPVPTVPLVPVPKHQSFPSGHASYAWAIAELIDGIVTLNQEQKAYLQGLAERISKNRERAGLHTDLDTEDGKKLGQALGSWMVSAAKDETTYPKWATLVADAQGEWQAGP